MNFDNFEARDLVAPDMLPPNLVNATVPGNVQLIKGLAPAPVVVLVELDVQTVAT